MRLLPLSMCGTGVSVVEEEVRRVRFSHSVSLMLFGGLFFSSLITALNTL